MERAFFAIGAFLGFTAVTVGAFGAHTLCGQLSTEMVEVFELAGGALPDVPCAGLTSSGLLG